MREPLRTAIVGCGGIAQRHAQNLAALGERFRLVAFADSELGRAQAFADRHAAGAAVYEDSAALLGNEELDALFICLPPFAHRDEVLRAAERGIHVFIEKPIALDSHRAWQMVQAAEAAGIVTQVGFMYRFGTAIGRLKQLMAEGQAGAAGLMSTRYFCNHLHAPWWRERDKSGGQLVEQVIHMVDLMRYLMGEADTVYSVQRNLYHQDVPNYTVEDVSGTVISFANGGIGVIYASNNAIPGKWINDYKVVAARLTAEFADANHATFHYTAETSLRSEEIASDADVYVAEVLDFADAIAEGRPALTPLREGARTLDLALAARASAESGSVVGVGVPV
jgi:predicted dehydrogenase